MSKTKWHSKVIHSVVALLVVALALVLSSSPVPVLAAPVVASVTETAFGSNTRDHYVNMPATVDGGDLLIVLFTNDGGATVTTPGGWSLLASDDNTAVRCSVYYKIAVGDEDGTQVNFATSGVEHAAAQVYRITNWHGTTPPEISTAVTGADAAPDPASLDPAGWDVANTLWIAVAGQDRGDELGTPAYPASYTDGISTLSSSGPNGCRTHSARRVLAAASEDPGAFTIPVPAEWVAFTIAVRPAPRDLTISSTVGGNVTTPGEGVFPCDEGTIVDLVAEAEEGYRFVKWTAPAGVFGNVDEEETTFTMPAQNVTVTANFELIPTYDLTMAADPELGGTATDLTNESPYEEDTVVSIKAAANEGYEFVNWTAPAGGFGNASAAETTFTMPAQNVTVTANFVAIYDLTMAADPDVGGTATDLTNESPYAEDTVVSIKAEANEGYEFVNWTAPAGGFDNASAAETTFTMPAQNVTVTANFELIPTYDLTMAADPELGGTATDLTNESPYEEDTVVSIKAAANEGYEFVNWTAPAGGFGNASAAETTFTMPAQNITVTANFVAVYDLTMAADPDVGGTATDLTNESPYEEDTVVSIKAAANEGYEFVNWTAPAGGFDNASAAETTFTMPAQNITVTANFVAVYDLTMAADPDVGGTATDLTDESPYEEDNVVSIKAAANEGYGFVNWTAPAGGFGNASAAETTFTMPAQNITVTANFVAVYALTMAADPDVGGTATDLTNESPYAEDTVVSIKAEANEGYGFVNWTTPAGGFGNASAAETTFTMPAQNVTVTANFELIPTYDLTMAADPELGGTATDLTNESPYEEDNVVSIKAAANEGYGFVNWTAPAGGFGNASAAETTFTMPAQNITVTANFVAVYALTMAADPDVGGTATDLTNESPYAEDTVVSIKAEANEGYGFVNWTTPAGGFDNASAAETTFTMPAQNVTVTANFEEIPPSPVYPTITTKATTTITTNSATLNMIYTVGDFSPVEVCFAYKKSTGSAWSSTGWVSKSGSGTYAKSITGLSSSTKYDFKAQLKYDSTVIEGTTLQFTTDTPSTPPPSGGGCFIATAAYGTPTAKQIDVLREFRDIVLLESTTGSQFVALYYQLSPPVADFISESSFLRTLVRELLVDPIVWVVEATGDIWRN